MIHNKLNLSRRKFIKVSALSCGSMMMAIQFSNCSTQKIVGAPLKSHQKFAPNAFIRIGTDDSITILIGSSEMGQGVTTSLPMIIAEELEVELKQIKVEIAPPMDEYINKIYGIQATGGSSSVRGFWEPMRLAGASAKALLVKAAADAFNSSVEKCQAKNGTVIHLPSGRSISYGKLSSRAALLPIPPEKSLKLKQHGQFTLIEGNPPRLDIPEKVMGTAPFGIDVKLPNMLIACIKRCPYISGKIKSYDIASVKKISGIKHIFPILNGIAIVADNFWSAQSGVKSLSVEWDKGNYPAIKTDDLFKQYKKLSSEEGNLIKEKGSAREIYQKSSKKLDVVYKLPFLAHATMEPMNCVADVKDDSCHLYLGTQSPQATQYVVSEITGLSNDQIFIHTTFLGGGFGRRSERDFVAEAVEISQKIEKPIKVVWSREDDMRNDFYRPLSYHHIQGSIDDHGKINSWHHRTVAPSILDRISKDWAPLYMPEWFPHIVKRSIGVLARSIMGFKADPTTVEGIKDQPYDIPNFHFDLIKPEALLPIGFWRSVGHSSNAFVVESFVDELAFLAKKDPYLLRQDLLKRHPRHLGVLNLVAEKSGWNKKRGKNQYQGIAVHKSFKSFVAQVVEISVKNGAIKIEKVFCAVDCGQIIHPENVVAQMESSIIFGLSATLYGKITLEEGKIVESNFHDYPVIRLNNTPDIEVHLVHNHLNPGGVGEPGTPPIAPALTNAIFSATGTRVRELPITLSDINIS